MKQKKIVVLSILLIAMTVGGFVMFGELENLQADFQATLKADSVTQASSLDHSDNPDVTADRDMTHRVPAIMTIDDQNMTADLVKSCSDSFTEEALETCLEEAYEKCIDLESTTASFCSQETSN